MSSLVAPIVAAQGRRLSAVGGAGTLIERNYRVFRRDWVVFITGFLEPVFYLLSIGIGVGKLVPGFEVGGQHIAYADFVAPGMLAASAMNGAIFDATFNVFFKLKYAKLYDQILATPRTVGDVARGEIGWALIRGGVYSTAFLLVMTVLGMVASWWALLAVPATLLVGYAFASVAMALTTWIRSWQDFEFITLALMPLFLFSATFFPITRYPTWLQWVVEATPLYRGVVLCRELATGAVGWGSLISVVYLGVMGALGTLLVRRRLATLLVT